jgi:hypothetical protein
MSNVATRQDVKAAVRTMTVRFALATLFIVIALGALVLNS